MKIRVLIEECGSVNHSSSTVCGASPRYFPRLHFSLLQEVQKNWNEKNVQEKVMMNGNNLYQNDQSDLALKYV